MYTKKVSCKFADYRVLLYIDVVLTKVSYYLMV